MLQIQIPRPIRYTVRGKVTGDLPEECGRVSVMFARDIGAIDPVGGASGASLQADGTFEHTALPGRYSVEVCEFLPPEVDGRTRALRRLGKGSINVVDSDLVGLEIQISTEDLG